MATKSSHTGACNRCDGQSFATFMKNVQHYKGWAVLIIRGSNGEVLGAVSDCWEDSGGRFAGSSECFLFSLLPAIQVCRPREDGCRNYAYLNAKIKQKPLGLGFGGQIGTFRLWVDSDLSHCKVMQCDPTYGLFCDISRRPPILKMRFDLLDMAHAGNSPGPWHLAPGP